MKINIKVSSFLIALTLFISSFILPNSTYALSGEISLEDNVSQDVPSKWAVDEIIDAEIYGVINQELSKDYKKHITAEDLLTLDTLLYNSLDTDSSNKDKIDNTKISLNEYVTKEDVMAVFYNTLKAIGNVKIDETDPVKYMISKNILKGSGNDLKLKSRCTKEQAIIISKRIYELVAKELGNTSKGLMWKVSGGKNDVYILGSIHIAKKDLYPLDSKITDIFKDSTHLSVEVNILDLENIQNEILDKGFYKEGSLKDNISEETHELLLKKLEEYGIDYSIFEKAKPWYTALSLATLDYQTSEYEKAMGIDQYFLTKGVFNKEILELEGAKFQFDLFDNFSPETQEENLEGTLLSLGKTNNDITIQGEMMQTMWNYWKNSDINGFEEIINIATKEDTEYNEKLWHERNINMTKKIDGYLNSEDEGTYFVVFGAGHLFGKTGVLKGLEERGYKLEHIK
ncbi:GumN family protein [Gottschalkia acidurici 9a]|uniref:GumN family protein n=1 Tax=Gottschalkia acidurici (strain ATCC 7906 / DSM 604 / BCRC 14475 / CIP 104303 / KCTC 5404 / NCIMB 10678 / 9a) TaxID=1128398 RepID=K0B365_GOTA9|nr:TraB/GumN family protein [Gottschalkia acidurici]AFS79617.1 GumN family protein [Gottschalkia acidurici 9a]